MERIREGVTVVQIGKLDQRIVVSQPTTTNTMGSVEKSYSDVATLWAYVISERGNEAFQAARTQGKAQIRVLVRYRADITNGWRVTWRSQNYNITYVDRSGYRKGELWLTCETAEAT